MSAKERGASQREKLRQAEELALRGRKKRRILAIVAIALVVLVVGGGIALQQYRTHRAPSTVSGPAGSVSPSPVAIVNGKPILLGRANAPVRVTLYEDFHCPHCADFEDEFASTITAAQEAGTVGVELYPMSFIDTGSAAAANAMACAAEAGFAQGYYLGLFANHTLRWQDSQLLDLASKVSGSVPETFKTCVVSKSHSAWVDSINAAAEQNGVSETPTMFVNGNPVDTASLTPESLKTMIAQAAGK